MKNKKYLIIYHSADNDGLMSMAIFYNWLLEHNVKANDIDLLGADYNMLSQLAKPNKNSETYEDVAKNWKDNGVCAVIITDVSFNEQAVMKNIYDTFQKHFIWVDHHTPIIEFSKTCNLQNAKGIRDTKHSAIYNAWKFCYPQKEIPETIKQISAFDSFSFEADGIPFNTCFAISEGFTDELELNPQANIKFIRTLIDGNVNEIKLLDKMRVKGENIIKQNDKNAKRTIKKYGDFSWKVNNEAACALFIQQQTCSNYFKSIKETTPHGIVFKHQSDGNWCVSLYNTDEKNSEFHCGEYLKKNYNGGGHSGAGGCTISPDKFIEILLKKQF